MKILTLLIILCAGATSVFAQEPLVLLADKPVRPSASSPLSPEQLASAAGNAFYARHADGSVMLVTANHVAESLGLRPVAREDDLAVLRIWPAGQMSAAGIPQIATHDEYKPVTVRGWSITENRLIVRQADPRPLVHSVRESAKATQGPNGVFSLDYWRTRMFEFWNPEGVETERLEFSSGTSGSAVYQDGKVVGVLVASIPEKGREKVLFQILIPKPRPAGLYLPRQ